MPSEELTSAGLDAQVVEVNSDKTPGTVTGQAPSAGTVVVEGTQVRINVSRGPQPVTVPNVIGFPYDQAASEPPAGRIRRRARRGRLGSDAGIVVGQTRAAARRARRVDGHRLGLEGPVDVRGARRHEPGRRDRADDARGRGLPLADGRRGHRRSDAGRDRHLAGPDRRHAGRAELAGHALRRALRRTPPRRRDTRRLP